MNGSSWVPFGPWLGVGEGKILSNHFGCQLSWDLDVDVDVEVIVPGTNKL
jgi:hypothetical protein